MQRLIKSHGEHVVISGAAGDEMLAGCAGYYQILYLRHLLNAGFFSEFIHELRANTEVNTLRSLRSLTLDLFLNNKSKSNISSRLRGQYALLKDILSRSLFASALQIPKISEERSFHGITIANMTYHLMNYWLRSGGNLLMQFL
jgi:asparagine synthetase B (glutamine-hydrolysing)